MELRFLLGVLVIAGCRVTASFECERDDQCTSSDSGRCEGTGFCSFVDTQCPSGRRYHEHAGDRGGECTAMPSPVDAAIDVPFTIASCPPAYAITLASTAASSRYRVIPPPGTFWVQEPKCNESSITHAVVIDTIQEASELEMVLDTMPGQLSYVGAVQDPNAALTDQGWIDVHGKPLLDLWGQAEPDDSGNGEADHGEQLAVFDRQNRALRDTNGGGNFAIVCECDGIPIAAIARTFIGTDPNNPN